MAFKDPERARIYNRDRERRRREALRALGLNQRGRPLCADCNSEAYRFECWLRRNGKRLDEIAMQDPVIAAGREKAEW